MDTAPPKGDTLTPPPAAARASARPQRPTGKLRRVVRLVVRSVVLAALVGLTAWNATRSEALTEAIEAEGRGDFTTALRRALDHLDRRPWSREADRVAARCLSRLDFAELAEPYYRRARPLSTEDLHYRAYGLVRANLRERANEAYEEILARNPGDVSALRLQAGVFLSQNRWDEAKSVARRLIKTPPGPSDVYTPVVKPGRWTLKTGRVESAAVIGHTLEGVVDHDTQDYDGAGASFERVIKLDPDLRSMPLDPTLFWAHLAFNLIQTGRSSDVIRYLTQVTDANPDAGLLDLLGQAHLQQSSPDAAERCWRQALALDPKHFGASLNLGRLELKRGRPAEAVALLQTAEALKPDAYEPVYSLGLAYRRLGQAGEAKRYEEKAGAFRRVNKNEPRGMGAPPAAKPPGPPKD